MLCKVAILNLLCIFSVIYFLFVIVLCVMSLAMTMYVMYLNGLADDDPVTAMPARVIIYSSQYRVDNAYAHSLFDHSY